MSTVFVNPERCIGCRQCELSCAVEHSVSKEMSTAFLESPVPHTRIHVEPGVIQSTSYPSKCRHCNPAPCMGVCPTGAISRNDDLDLVLIDGERCIGCAVCAVVCPFDALTFHHSADRFGGQVLVATKCDGCVDRLQKMETPACVEVCKVDALVFGELNNLIAQERLRQAGAMLAAAGATASMTFKGDPLLPWHAFGEELDEVADAALADGKVQPIR